MNSRGVTGVRTAAPAAGLGGLAATVAALGFGGGDDDDGQNMKAMKASATTSAPPPPNAAARISGDSRVQYGSSAPSR